MHALKTALTIGLMAALPSTALAGGNEWVDDFDHAVTIAKKEGKDLLVDFTGSDWCGWCIKLHDEVFQYDDFLKPARESYVLVSLDFPRKEPALSKVPNPERNRAVAEQYGVRGYPTVLLMTADGDVFGRTGYQAGGAEKYVEHMAELRAAGMPALEKINGFVSAYEAATGEAKLVALKDAMTFFETLPGDAPGLGKLVPVVKSAFSVDPDDAQGLKSKAAKMLLGAGQADAEVLAAGSAVDPKNEAGILEQVVLAQCELVKEKKDVPAACEAIAKIDALGIHDQDVALILYVNGAGWNHRFTDDAEAAKKFARKAKALNPEHPGMVQMLDTILGS